MWPSCMFNHLKCTTERRGEGFDTFRVEMKKEEVVLQNYLNQFGRQLSAFY